MARRSSYWFIAGVVFAVVNVGGALIAAVRGEVMHTAGHVGLLLLGGIVVTALMRRRDDAYEAAQGNFEEGLSHLQRSVDTLSIELERVSEAQRFMTQIVTQRSAGQSAANSIYKPSNE